MVRREGGIFFQASTLRFESERRRGLGAECAISQRYITKIDKKVKQSIGIVSFQNEGHRVVSLPTEAPCPLAATKEVVGSHTPMSEILAR